MDRYDDLEMRFKARLVSVTRQPSKVASVAVVERCDNRTTVVCRLASGGWQEFQRYMGRVISVSGSPVYSGEGQLLRIDDCELYVG